MDLALSVYERKAPQGSACVPGRNGLHRLQVVAHAVPGLLGSKVELCPPGPWAVALTGSWVCAERVGTVSSQARVGLTPCVWGPERSGEGVLNSDPGRRKRACRCEDRGDGLGRTPSRAPSGQPHPGPGLQPVRTQLRSPGTPAPGAGLCLGLASSGCTHLCALLLRLSSSGSHTFSDQEQQFPTS